MVSVAELLVQPVDFNLKVLRRVDKLWMRL